MRKTRVVLILAILLVVGCSNQTTNTDKSKATPIISSELNSLNKDEFLKTYSNLPYDYLLEYGDGSFYKDSFDYDYQEFKYPSEETKYDQKAGLTRRKSFAVGGYSVDEWDDWDEEESREYKSREKRMLSLRGLRFFRKLDDLYLEGCHISEIDELQFLPEGFRSISFKNCSFEEPLFDLCSYLNETQVWQIAFVECELTNLDFLQEFSSLDGKWLFFSNNKINDISVFNKFSNNSLGYLFLDSNEISDLEPLKNLQFEHLNLNYNRIQDPGVLTELKVGTVIEIADNCLLDYSSIKKHIDYFFSANHYFVDPVPRKYAKKMFRMDRDGNYKLVINGKRISEKEIGKLTFFNDSQYLEYSFNLRELEPACNAIKFVELLGGTAVYDKVKGLLECSLNGRTYRFFDFSETVECEDESMVIKYPMRIMQGDVPYLAISDMKELFEFNTKIIKNRYFYIFDAIDSYLKVKMISEVRVIFDR